MSAEFHQWCDDFRRSQKGMVAVDSLLDLEKHGKEPLSVLEQHVLFHCYEAQKFDQKMVLDLLQKKRDFDEAKREQAKAIRAIKLFAKKYPAESAVSLARSMRDLTTECPGVSIEPKNMDYAWFLENLMDRYENELDEMTPFVSPRVGPFVYDGPRLDQKNFPDLAVVGLLFHLVVTFRDWTETGYVLSHGSGHRMPKHGRPCFRQAALFVNATLNKDLTSDQARSRLKKFLQNNPDARICRFPEYQA